MFGLQPLDLVVILALALLIFGPSRLPEISKALGNSIREFREASTATQDAIRKGMESKPKNESESKSNTPPKA